MSSAEGRAMGLTGDSGGAAPATASQQKLSLSSAGPPPVATVEQLPPPLLLFKRRYAESVEPHDPPAHASGGGGGGLTSSQLPEAIVDVRTAARTDVAAAAQPKRPSPVVIDAPAAAAAAGSGAYASSAKGGVGRQLLSRALAAAGLSPSIAKILSAARRAGDAVAGGGSPRSPKARAAVLPMTPRGKAAMRRHVSRTNAAATPPQRRAASAPRARPTQQPGTGATAPQLPAHERLYALGTAREAARNGLAATAPQARHGGAAPRRFTAEQIEAAVERLYSGGGGGGGMARHWGERAGSPLHTWPARRGGRDRLRSAPAAAQQRGRPHSGGNAANEFTPLSEAFEAFLRRQDVHLARRADRLRRAHAERERAEHEERARLCTFAPSINPASRGMHRGVGQLHAWDARRRAAALIAAAEREERAYSGATFAPAIDARSRALALAAWAGEGGHDPRRPWTAAPVVGGGAGGGGGGGGAATSSPPPQYVPPEWARSGSPTCRAAEAATALLEAAAAAAAAGSPSSTMPLKARVATAARGSSGDGDSGATAGERLGSTTAARVARPTSPPRAPRGELAAMGGSANAAPLLAPGDGVAFVRIGGVRPAAAAAAATAAASTLSMSAAWRSARGQQPLGSPADGAAMAAPRIDSGKLMARGDESAKGGGAAATAAALRKLVDSGVPLQPTLSAAVRAALALAEAEEAQEAAEAEAAGAQLQQQRRSGVRGGAPANATLPARSHFRVPTGSYAAQAAAVVAAQQQQQQQMTFEARFDDSTAAAAAYAAAVKEKSSSSSVMPAHKAFAAFRHPSLADAPPSPGASFDGAMFCLGLSSTGGIGGAGAAAMAAPAHQGSASAAAPVEARTPPAELADGDWHARLAAAEAGLGGGFGSGSGGDGGSGGAADLADPELGLAVLAAVAAADEIAAPIEPCGSMAATVEGLLLGGDAGGGGDGCNKAGCEEGHGQPAAETAQQRKSKSEHSGDRAGTTAAEQQ